jgi:F-type H+-transporting ATPase subunit alpha
MEKQVTILYAGTRGFLDKLPVETLADYESELYNYIESNDPSIFSDLKEKKEFTDEIKAKVEKALTSFGETFRATKGLK